MEMLPLDDEISLPVSIGVVGPSLVVARVFDNDSTNRFNYITKWSSFLRERLRSDTITSLLSGRGRVSVGGEQGKEVLHLLYKLGRRPLCFIPHV